MVSKNEASTEICMGGWHLKKEVTIGQLVTIAAILISGLWWASSVETRLANGDSERMRIEQKTDIVINAMNDRFDSYQNTVSQALIEIKRGIERLNDKIDKKADK